MNALWLLAGLGVTGAAGWWRGSQQALRALGVSYLAGVGAYGVVAQLLYVLGASLTRLEVLGLCSLLALGLLRPLAADVPSERHRAGRRVGLPALCTGAGFAALAVDLWFQPLWAYDSWTFWTPKARALYALGGLDRWFAAPELLNRDYPLLLPAVEAAGFQFTGYETALLDLQSLAFAAALLLVYAEVVAPRAPRWAAALPVLVVFAPSLADQLAYAEADVPLAAFFASAVLLGLLWHRDRTPGALPLMALFSAATAATKVEGLPFVLVLVAALAAAELRRSPRRAVEVAAWGVGALLFGLLPWRLWMNLEGIPNQSALSRVVDLRFLVNHFSRVPTAAVFMTEKLLDPRAWLLLVPLLVVLSVIGIRSGSSGLTALLLAIVGLSFATLLLAYWTTPFELNYHLATSARRVITAPLLAWAISIPLVLDSRTEAEAAATLRA